MQWKGEGRGLGLKVFIGWVGSHFTLTRIGLKFESQELISTKIYLSPFIHSTMDRNLKYLVDTLDEQKGNIECLMLDLLNFHNPDEGNPSKQSKR